MYGSVTTYSDHIEWVSKTLTKALELAPSDIEISIRIFVTSGKVPELAQTETRSFNEDDSVHSSSDGTAIGKSRPSSLLNFPVVQVSQGRPDLRALLREEVDANTGRLSVTGTGSDRYESLPYSSSHLGSPVCGSQGIARTCRSALKIPMSVTLNGGPSVVLHVESFGYA